MEIFFYDKHFNAKINEATIANYPNKLKNWFIFNIFSGYFDQIIS